MSAKKLERKVILTEDGSHTLYVPSLDENYHSIHGAKQESNHVFIKSGLHFCSNKNEINIFEVGFGTGLNALLSYVECKKLKVKINYTTVEKYPITQDELALINYKDLMPEYSEIFLKLHEAEWGKVERVSEFFELHKIEADLVDVSHENKYDVVYFDAFAPDLQPDLWSEKVFQDIYNSMSMEGILVTYSAKGFVKRNLKSAGFTVTKIPGPPGKREMIRAVKN